MTLIVYTKYGCPWREEVISFLNEKQIPFEERDVSSNAVFFDEMIKKSGQQKTPTLDLDGDILSDADAPAVEEFLRNKGIL